MNAPEKAPMPHVMNTYGRLPIALSHGRGCWVWDTEGNQAERRILHDVALWRDQLRSVEEYRARNVATRFADSTARLCSPLL